MKDSLSVLKNKRIMFSSLSIIDAVVLVTSVDVFVTVVVVVIFISMPMVIFLKKFRL